MQKHISHLLKRIQNISGQNYFYVQLLLFKNLKQPKHLVSEIFPVWISRC